jgi:hypothetical protein
LVFIILIIIQACGSSNQKDNHTQKRGDNESIQKNESICNLEGFLLHNNNEPIDLFNKINGQKIKKIYPDEEGAGLIAKIIGHNDGWIQINLNDQQGWIQSDKIGTATRNYDDSELNLYSESSKSSEKSGVLFGEQIVIIIGCSGDWALVKGKDKQGNIISGWLEPGMQCPSPYTTCP